MQEQSRKASLLEVVLNIGSGFVLAFVAWQFIVAPMWDYRVTLLDNLGLTSIFTFIGALRSYVWRRGFNWWQKRRRVKRARGR